MMNFVSAGVQAQAESSSRQQQAAAANNEDIELPDVATRRKTMTKLRRRVFPLRCLESSARELQRTGRRKALVPRRMSSLAPLRGSSEGVNDLPLLTCKHDFEWCFCSCTKIYGSY
jgi:hypothetical protein